MRLVGLDAMRGYAALTVVGFHVFTIYDVADLFDRAYLAVDFFFMLSGYVMARTYETKFAGGLNPISFTLMRYRRLFWPMAVGAAIGLFFFARSDLVPVAIIYAATLFYIPNGPVYPFLLNKPAWSILFELVANALHAVLMWRLPVWALGIVAAASAGTLYAFAGPDILVGHRNDNLWLGVPRVLLAYTIGIMLFRLNCQKTVPPVFANPGLVVALLFIPEGFFWDLAFVMLVSPALLVAGLSANSNRFSAILGAISFPLYAVHYPILQIGEHVGAHPIVAVAAALAVAAGVALTFEWKRNAALFGLASPAGFAPKAEAKAG